MNEAEVAVAAVWGKFINVGKHIRNILPPGFPEIVTLCGSTRFADAYAAETRRLTLEGCIVISVGLFGHQEGLDMAGEAKAMLDELHLRKIDIADRIHVVNPVCRVCAGCARVLISIAENETCWCGRNMKDLPRVPYVGESTRREIEYAVANGKAVTYMEPPQ